MLKTFTLARELLATKELKNLQLGLMGTLSVTCVMRCEILAVNLLRERKVQMVRLLVLSPRLQLS